MTTPARGTSSTVMRVATCKDCRREIAGLERDLALAEADGRDGDVRSAQDQLARRQQSAGAFSYSEHSAIGQLDRGGSRSDRCPEHRKKHRANTQGMAVAYVDLETIGETLGAHSKDGPTGPLGGLGPLPAKHEKQERTAKLAEYEFGMTDLHIVEILELLRDHRVLVLRAGTGTGKSTFGPYRLMDPPTMAELADMDLLEQLADLGVVLPPEGPFRLTELGPIVVTEPRVAAATGVSQFVGEKLAMGCGLKQCTNPAHGSVLLFNPKAHTDDPAGVVGPSCEQYGKKDRSGRLLCTREHVGRHPGGPPGAELDRDCVVGDCAQHVGPGFPVGYQAKGVRHWDEACQLVFATDGAVINWLRDGRLNKIGTIIVDEAHERSTNIDFILGYLKRDLARYPHLRVIITSATFEPRFYEEYFSEYHPGLVAVKDVPAVKTVGYGLPLFPDLDLAIDAPDASWPETERWPLVHESEPDVERLLSTHWADRYAPALKEHEVVDPAEAKGGENEYIEDLWATTRALLPLRLEAHQAIPDTTAWRSGMPDLLADFVIKLEAGLATAGIFGDILGFLPTEKMIRASVERIEGAVGDRADVLPLLSKLKEDEVDEALAARRKGDRRKIVISTNLAETSLTVEGVRFVVDSGLIAQSEWKPDLAAGGVSTTLHSRSGIKQRWGRVGRKAPGWVFPLYTKKQFAELPEDTPPGSARENLEQLMMTARMGGIDDVLTFPWPAAFEPKSVTLDAAGQAARRTFISERDRADVALRVNGAVTDEGYPTALGRELTRFSGLGTAAAMAVLCADRLACVPEVVTVLALLEDKQLVGADCLFQDDYAWPDEWRVEAYNRHRGLASLAEDDAHLALLICAAWERADSQAAPWEPSAARRQWCRQWWVDNDVLLTAAAKRQDVLATLSPAMKKEVKRFIEPSLLDRARGVLAQTMRATEFRLEGDEYLPAVVPPRLLSDGTVDMTPTRFAVEPDSAMQGRPERVLALRRRQNRGGDCFISALVILPTQPSEPETRSEFSELDAMAMIVDFQRNAPVNALRDVALPLLTSWPIGQRVRLRYADVTGARPARQLDVVAPFVRPPLSSAEYADDEVKRPRRGRRHRSLGVDDDTNDTAASDGDGDFANRRIRGAFDEEAASRWAFEHADRHVGAADREAEFEPCRECPPCLDGNPRRCVVIKRLHIRTKDVLKEWRDRVESLERTSMAKVSLQIEGGAATNESALFEVVEYRDGSTTEPVVVLAPDWRAEGAHADPSKHNDIRAGQHVDVVVGGTVRDHKDELRVFVRADGRGRFLLREANAGLARQVERGVIAASLSAGATGLLSMLEPGRLFTATVVPGRADDTFTITTLPMLHQHLALGRRGAAVTHAAGPNGRHAPRTPYFHAVVHTPPNDHGYLAMRLLHADTARGIHHLISLNTRIAGPEADADNNPSASTPWAEGTAHQLALVPDIGGYLDVSGLNLDALREVTRDPVNGLFMPRGPADDANGSPDDGRSVGARLAYTTETASAPSAAVTAVAAPGTKIRVRKDYGKPLSSKVAEVLAALAPDSATWQNKVWAFWARSFHVKVDERGGVLPGDSIDVIDSPLDRVEIDEELPSVLADREFAKFAQRTGSDCTVTGRVLSVSDSVARIDLDEEFDGVLLIRNVAHDRVGSMTAVFQRGDDITANVVAHDAQKRNVVLSTQSLLPSPLQRFRQAHRIGEQVSGIVSGTGGGRVHVVLEHGARGSILFRNLWHQRVEDLEAAVPTGHQVRAVITEFEHEHERVELTLKELHPTRADHFRSHLRPDRVVAGVITDVKSAGANVELAAGVLGWLHISQLASYRVTSVESVVSIGQRVEVRVLEVDTSDPGRPNLKLTLRDVTGPAAVVPGFTQPQLSWPGPQGLVGDAPDDATTRRTLIEARLLRTAPGTSATSSGAVPISPAEARRSDEMSEARTVPPEDGRDSPRPGRPLPWRRSAVRPDRATGSEAETVSLTGSASAGATPSGSAPQPKSARALRMLPWRRRSATDDI